MTVLNPARDERDGLRTAALEMLLLLGAPSWLPSPPSPRALTPMVHLIGGIWKLSSLV